MFEEVLAPCFFRDWGRAVEVGVVMAVREAVAVDDALGLILEK